MYADDTVIFYSNKSINRIRENLQNDFDRFNEWLKQNELVINTKIGKTETMILGTGKRISMTEKTSLEIKHQGRTINQTDYYRYLGLSLNNTLCMSEHLKSSIKIASSRLNLLKKMRFFSDSKTAALIYQLMILPPHVLFSCNLRLNPNYLRENVQILEKRAHRIISGKYIQCS